MDSSEIEVVPLDSNPNHHQPAITDVFSASAYGDLNSLKRFVEHNGSSVSLPDANGYYPLQWAALNNSLHVAQYIIEVNYVSSSRDRFISPPHSDLIKSLYIYVQHGGDVNASDNTKQTALHWAAVKGSVDVADLLLLHGARIEADDMNGYRVKNPFFLMETNLYCMSKDWICVL